MNASPKAVGALVAIHALAAVLLAAVLLAAVGAFTIESGR